MASESKFVFDGSKLINGILETQKRAEAAMMMYGSTAATNLEDYMKQNAPWTDRSGQARRTLSAKNSKIPNGIKITLAYGVNYGASLEMAHEKRYAIIEPTIRLKSADIMKQFAGLLQKMGFSKI